MKYRKRLNKGELRHIKEWCGGTLRGLKENLKAQECGQSASCMVCRDIAYKLGIKITQ